MSDLVKIGALWKPDNKSDRGPTLTGKLGDARLVIFPNKYKETDNHPDYVLYVENPKKREEKLAPSAVPEEDCGF